MDVRYLTESLRLKITCLQPFRVFGGDAATAARATWTAERKFDVMAQLGAELLLVGAAHRDGPHRHLASAAAVQRALGAFPADCKNYYEDIAARWWLDERVESFRANNVLFDRDDGGEFLHAYTDAFDNRFFFEIVQRIGG
ncbi:hypothetical protein [Rhodopila sp.]|uniref:hypothetical protein n=1 Tax=Rhodopila sp. TaxID=2480087 RepID=UPI003D0F234F